MAFSLTTSEPAASAQARGKRLKIVRLMMDLTRKAFEEKCGICTSTLQAWEAAKAGGLTVRGVKHCLPIFLTGHLASST